MIQNLRYVIILPSFLIAVFLLVRKNNSTSILPTSGSSTNAPLTYASSSQDEMDIDTKAEATISTTTTSVQKELLPSPSQTNIPIPIFTSPRESSEVEKWTHLLLGRKFVKNHDPVDEGRMARWFKLLDEDVRFNDSFFPL